MKEMLDAPASVVEWLDARGPEADIVLSTRVRLARNMEGFRFGPRAEAHDREGVLELLRRAAESVSELSGGSFAAMERLSARSREVLLERHLVSRDLIGGENGPASHTALLLAPDDVLGVMVNEEDHLRLQGLVSGFRLRETWCAVDQLDTSLAERLPYAFHPEYGYLTSCPTNAGTGLRASVLVHLPALVLTQEIGKVLQAIAQVGLTFRGLYGEGSEVVGNFFQISNQTTLGKSEEELIEHLQAMVERVVQQERRARAVLLRDAPGIIEDKVWRAFGLLRYARSLSFAEGMNLLSGVRLGVSLKLLSGPRVYTLNQLMVFSQAAHLEQVAGRALPAAEADAQRAAYIRSTLAAEGDPSDAADSSAREN